MKKIISIALILLSSAAWSQTTSSTATSSPVSTSTAAVGVGNTQNITFSNPADSTTTINGSTTLRNVPSLGTTLLTTSGDTCMGSTSGSVVMAGFGLAGGSTYVDSDCKRLKNSRELWNMGMKAASLALMCNDADNQAALELSGYECPQTTAAKAKVTAEVAAGVVQYTDPIVRSRLGLAPLVKTATDTNIRVRQISER